MRKILVVDDVALVREPIEALLREEGYEAHGASSGSEALIRLESDAPDLVLLDLSMPTMDGIRVLDTIRSHPRLHAVPVIILSSDNERSRVREAARLGISGYILKSRFSASEFLLRIDKQFASRSPSAGKSTNAPDAQNHVPVPKGAMEPVPEATGGRTAVHVKRVSARRGNSAGQFDHFGDALAALHALTPIVRRGEVTEKLAKGADLQGLSPVVGEVLKLTRSDHCPTEAIAKAISQDSAIALKVLSLANSSVFSRGDCVDSLHRAVTRIGLERIRHTVVNVAVVDRFSAAAFDDHLDSSLFWEHSVACGTLAAEIAQLLTRGTGDAAFTAGLFHDVGRLVFAELLGDQYVDVLESARDAAIPLEQVETRMLLVNHADVMDRLVRLWGLPESMINPMLLHHLSSRGIHAAAPAEMNQTYGLALANRLAHALLLGSSGNDTIYSIDDLCAAVGIEADALSAVIAVAKQKTEEIRSSMICKPVARGAPKRVEYFRAALSSPLKPLFLSQQQGTDAFRIFCETLSDPNGEADPNIAIVNAARTADPASLFVMLDRVEQERGLKNLPTIVLSQIGRPLAVPGSWRGRPYRHLPTPFAVPRFVAAVNELYAES